MKVKDAIRLLAVFIVVSLTSYQFVFAEPNIGVRSSARNSGGGFLSETIVDFIIIDPHGRKLGHDPYSNNFYSEFGNGYGTSGIDDISGAEASISPEDGTYIIEVFGEDLMMFTIEFRVYREIKGEGFNRVEISGVTDEDQRSKFQFTYIADPSKPAGSIQRIASPAGLKQDITLSHKIGWIDNDGIMQSLLKKVAAVEASIARGNKTAARNQLNAFINEVNAQKDKHISSAAVKILLEDAQYIMGTLTEGK